MLLFGMPVLAGLPDLAACVHTAQGLGLSFVEMNASFPQYIPSPVLYDTAKRLQRETGVGYTLHLDEQLNPFDFNPQVASVYLGCALSGLEMALALQMKRVNMHLLPGVYVTLPEKRIYLCEIYKDEYLQRVRAFRDACQEKLKGSQTLLCVENTDGFTPFQQDALALLLDSPYFGLTLDTGHNMAIGRKDEAVYRRWPERLAHMHLHACVAGSPHKPLDQGPEEIPRYLALAKEASASCVIEVKTPEGLSSSVQYLIKKEEIKA